MRNVEMIPVTDLTREMETLYGQFDVGPDGLPTAVWENRNITRWKPVGGMMQHYHFPQIYMSRIRVNHRLVGPLSRTYEEIVNKLSIEDRRAHGLDQFVKCYAFGEGEIPNLHWWGGAWELSPKLESPILEEILKIFIRHGFTRNKKLLRTVEFW